LRRHGLLRFDGISYSTKALQHLIGVKGRESYVGRIIPPGVDDADNSGEPKKIFVHDPYNIVSRKVVYASWKAVRDEEAIAIDSESHRRRSARATMERIVTGGQPACVDEANLSICVALRSVARAVHLTRIR
jgi:hypothetical protein